MTVTAAAGDRRTVSVGRGRTIEIRPARPDDDVGLWQLYDALDDADRQRRFFSLYQPDLAFFRAMATEAERGGARLVAELRGPSTKGRIVGEAGYTMLPNGDGELGMVVDSRWRGWLGPYLLDALTGVAAAAGVPNLEADVLTTNQSMQALLRSRGMAVLEHEDWTVSRVIVGTGGERPEWPEWPDGHDRPRILVEGAGGRWPAESAARAAGAEVITCPGPREGPRGCPVLAGRSCPLAAGADVIVVSRPGADERWRRLLAGHADVHDGVPVCSDSAMDLPDLLAFAARRADRRRRLAPQGW